MKSPKTRDSLQKAERRRDGGGAPIPDLFLALRNARRKYRARYKQADARERYVMDALPERKKKRSRR